VTELRVPFRLTTRACRAPSQGSGGRGSQGQEAPIKLSLTQTVFRTRLAAGANLLGGSQILADRNTNA